MTEVPGVVPPNIAESTRRKEVEPTSERFFVPQADIITVSGPHHTFKTAAAEVVTGKSKDPRNRAIQRQLRIRGIGLTAVGQWVRTQVQRTTGKPFEDALMNYPAEEDEFIDSKQQEIMTNVRVPHQIIIESGETIYGTDQPVMVEGRYSGFLGAKVAHGLAGRKHAPRIERVLFYSSNPMALVSDAAARYLEDNPGSDLTQEELEEIELDRELKIAKKAQATWPDDVMGQDIFDPEMVTPDGKKVYTITIDVAGKTPHQIFEEFHAQLLARKAIWEVKKGSFAPTEEGQSAFDMIRHLLRCEGLVDQYHCNRYGVRTLDVYIGGFLKEQIPVCATDDHAGNVRRRTMTDLGRTFDKSYLHIAQNGYLPDYRTDGHQALL